MNLKGPLAALALLALAGCAEEPGMLDISGLADDSDPAPADRPSGFHAEDSGGRLMPTNHVPAWRSRVAVYSADAKLEKDGRALIEMNFNVRLVSVPESRFLIRLIPLKGGGFKVGTQFNGVRTEGPAFATRLRGHEDAQDAFVDFVGEQMEKAR